MSEVEKFMRHLAAQSSGASASPVSDVGVGEEATTYAQTVRVGAQAGFQFSEDDLRRWVDAELAALKRHGELSDAQLDQIAGASGSPYGDADRLLPGQINAILGRRPRPGEKLGVPNSQPEAF